MSVVIADDPLKLNRGQVGHFNHRKQGLTDSLSESSDGFKSYISKKAKNSVSNAVFLDWFETTVTLSESVSSGERDGWNFDLTTGTGSLYGQIWNVYHLGEHFGVLQTCPLRPYVDAYQAQFKVVNEYLYRSDWLDLYKELYDTFSWKHKSSTRTDIALDGAAANDVQSLTMRSLQSCRCGIGRKGKAKVSITYGSKNQVEKFHIGSSKSEKTATIYHKSDELESSGKDYIREAWKKNGVSIDSVHRLELRMKAKKGNNYDWRRYDDPKYLASILRTECKNWCEFYYMGKDKNKTRAYKNGSIDWVDWDSISGELLPKQTASKTSAIHKAKQLVRSTLYFHHVHGKDYDHELFIDVLNEYTLHRWLEVRIDSWLSEWKRERLRSGYSAN